MPPLLTTHQALFPRALYLGSGISFLYPHLLCIFLFCAFTPSGTCMLRGLPHPFPQASGLQGDTSTHSRASRCLSFPFCPSHVHHGASVHGLKQALFPVVAVLTLRCAPVLCCVHRVLKAEQSLVYALLKRERKGFSSSHQRQTPLKPMSHPQAHGFVGEAWALKEFRWNFFTPSAHCME